MKTLSRIGIFFLALAVSLLLATFQRAYSPVSTGAAGNVEPDKWLKMTTRLLSPQNLRIAFSTVNGTPINLYLLTSQGLQEWKETGTLNPMISIENLSSTVGTYDIPSRDFYTLLAYNPNNTTEGIDIDLTLYGFEKDLTLAIVIITIIGIALPTICFISGKLITNPHKKQC